jgi:hypothetical protein
MGFPPGMNPSKSLMRTPSLFAYVLMDYLSLKAVGLKVSFISIENTVLSIVIRCDYLVDKFLSVTL